MKDKEWEMLIRSKALMFVESGSASRFKAYNSSSYDPSLYNGFLLRNKTLINSSTADLALSCEYFLKAATVYYHLRYSPELRSLSNQSVNLNSKMENYLKNPISMGKEFPYIASALSGLSKSDLAGKGHGLYTYYKIQDPLIKMFINHTFLSADSSQPGKMFTYIDLGILTRDFITEDQDGRLYLPQDLIENYKKYKTKFMDDLR